LSGESHTAIQHRVRVSADNTATPRPVGRFARERFGFEQLLVSGAADRDIVNDDTVQAELIASCGTVQGSGQYDAEGMSGVKCSTAFRASPKQYVTRALLHGRPVGLLPRTTLSKASVKLHNFLRSGCQAEAQKSGVGTPEYYRGTRFSSI